MNERPHPEVSVIIVSYNVREDLRRCLESLVSLHEDGMTETIVVDNASNDGSAALVQEQFPWATLVQNAQNIGFAAGVNQGLARANGAFILLLNPDTVVCTDTVERLLTFMRAHPECGIAGGQLLNPDHSPQESSRSFPTPASLVAESLFLTRLLASNRRGKALHATSRRPRPVDAVVGACLMARREMVQHIGPLDERFFLYSEETDWCRRARQHGWTVYTLPDAPVIHGLGRSTDAQPDAAFIELYRSRHIYMRKHFGGVSRWLTHGGMLVGVVLRVVLWGLALIIHRLQHRTPARVVKKFSQNRAVLEWYLRGCPTSLTREGNVMDEGGREMMERRYQREQEIHNKFYSEGTREVVEKFYTVVRSSRRFYEDFLQSHCTNKHVLEYGCGSYGYLFSLVRRGATVTGIDISDVAIEQARQRARREQLEHITLRVMNAEALAFDTNTFDIICGTGVLHHLDLSKALSEVARTLKSDGAAIFIEPLGHNPIINLYRKATPDLRTEDEHPLLMEDLQMAEVYFGKVETHFFHLHSLLAIPFRNWPGFSSLLRVLDTIDSVVFRSIPFVRKYAWQVVILLSQAR